MLNTWKKPMRPVNQIDKTPPKKNQWRSRIHPQTNRFKQDLFLRISKGSGALFSDDDNPPRVDSSLESIHALWKALRYISPLYGKVDGEVDGPSRCPLQQNNAYFYEIRPILNEISLISKKNLFCCGGHLDGHFDGPSTPLSTYPSTSLSTSVNLSVKHPACATRNLNFIRLNLDNMYIYI